MSEAINKPYELSIWADLLVTSPTIESSSYYKEQKIAVIGSDRMDTPSAAFDIVLKENINGEKTLTFSLRHKYYDVFSNELIDNHLADYLTNERKVKLYYDNKWYDFVIKEIEETSEEYIYSYTAQDLFILELSKIGYNIAFNKDLNNNQGTVTELAEKTLENTDWIVDKENSDLLRQKVKEPLYKCKITSIEDNLRVLNVDDNTILPTHDLEADETIYIFYSYLSGEQGKYIQFIREKDKTKGSFHNEFEVDSEDVILSTNYRFLEEKAFFEKIGEAITTIYIGTDSASSAKAVITVEGLYNLNQAYRLVYGQKTIYDPVKKRTVKLYQADYEDTTQDIYNYIDYQYITSDIVSSFVTNGEAFEITESGEVQGWSQFIPSAVKSEGASITPPLGIVSYPEIQHTIDLCKLQNFADVTGYIELQFAKTYNSANGTDAYFNSGFMDNSVVIDHIAAGEKFVLRLRYGYANSKHGPIFRYGNGSLGVGQGVRALVANYEIVEEEFINSKGEKSVKHSHHIIPNTTVLDFNGTFEESNNYITGGHFDGPDRVNYIIDNVIQTPSTKYCYKVDGDSNDYVWNTEQSQYTVKPNNYLPYYATVATARSSISTETLTDPEFRLGLFIYTPDVNLTQRGNNQDNIDRFVYIEDIQVTRYYEDANKKIVTIGNVPEAQSIETNYYYLKPTDKTKGEATNIYSDLSFLALESGLNVEDIKPVYNENCEKVLSIEESQSNCFNILQSLCETFECWLKIEVEHDENGALILNSDMQPIKKVCFKEFIGKENFAGFKYGINLNSITRTRDSNEFVTKLIVENVTNENVDEGYVSIQNASSNTSRESYILNFSHYLQTGLIQDKEAYNIDFNAFNSALRILNDKIFDTQKERRLLESAINKNKSNIDVLDKLVVEAKENYNNALVRFEQGTGISYAEYVKKYNEDKESVEDWLNNQDIADLIGEIYTCAITINNYSGIVTNLKQGYDKIKFELYGAKEYGININTAPDPTVPSKYITTFILEDYVEGLEFVLRNDVGFEQTYKTTFNEKQFTSTVNEGHSFTHCIIKKLPNHYQLQSYKNGEAYIYPQTENIDLVIYQQGATSSLTKHFKIIPEKEWSSQYPNLEDVIKDATEQKKAIEKEFYTKYSRFIQEGTWSSNDYIDSELYYLDAQQVSRTSSKPKVSYEIKVSEVSGLEDYRNYNFAIGDHTYIEDEEFFGSTITVYGNENERFETPNKEEVVISEIEWHLNEPENNVITVKNYKTQFEDLFQRLSATVQTVQFNEIAYPKTSSILGIGGYIDADLLKNSWNSANASGYYLTSNGTIQTDSEGILVQDLTNRLNRVKIISRGIKITSDGGQTWTNVIDGTGINASALKAGVINTQQIQIMNGDNPSFRWDKAGISAYGFGQSDDGAYDFKTYVRLDKYGLYGIKNGENYVATSLQDIKDKANFGLTWEGFFIKNSYTDGYVSISSDDDFQVVTLNEEQEFEMPLYGVKAVELYSFLNRISFPYDNRVIYKIFKEVDDTEESESEIEITDYIYNNGVIEITQPGITDGLFRIEYVELLNSIDLGGKGIIEINSVLVNDNSRSDYTYNRENGLLVFSEELFPFDRVTVNYKLERIKIGATKFRNGIPSKYGIEVRNRKGETVFETNDEGNLFVTGTINATNGVFRGTVYAQEGEFTGRIQATSGEFLGSVSVGNGAGNHIYINGEDGLPFIASETYLNDEQEGWIINGEGDAIFNNVSVRGAVKTSVFEYGEIQAVGGIFLFRPSDVIERAEVRIVEGEEKSDLILFMKKPDMFKVGDWCKLGGIDGMIGNLQEVFPVKEVYDRGRVVVLAEAGEYFKGNNSNG